MAENGFYDVLFQYVCSPEDSSICDWTVWITRISWLFVAIGTAGNVLNLLVLSRRKMRAMPTSVFWICLACADTCSLWTLTFAQTTVVEKDELIYKRGEFFCVISLCFVHTTGGFSVWLLVLLTVERSLCILWPHSTRLKLTRRKAMIVSAVTLGVLALSNSHFIFGYTWDSGNDTCVYSSEEYESFIMTGGYPYLVLVVYCLIPLTVISVGNITIARKLLKKFRNKSSAISAAKMVFFVSCLFICSTVVPGVYWLVVKSLEPSILERSKIPIQLAGAVLFLLFLSNFTFNFFLYCASSTVFRKEFKKIARSLRAKLPQRAEPSQEEETVTTVL